MHWPGTGWFISLKFGTDAGKVPPSVCRMRNYIHEVPHIVLCGSEKHVSEAS